MPTPTSLPTNVAAGGTATGHRTHTDTVHTAVNSLTVLPASTHTGSITLALSDSGEVKEMNSASATTVTVPPNSSVAFPTGTVIEVFRLGTGTVTLTPGAGVTIRTPGVLTLRAQYSSASLRSRGPDEWVAAGDLG